MGHQDARSRAQANQPPLIFSIKMTIIVSACFAIYCSLIHCVYSQAGIDARHTRANTYMSLVICWAWRKTPQNNGQSRSRSMSWIAFPLLHLPPQCYIVPKMNNEIHTSHTHTFYVYNICWNQVAKIVFFLISIHV